MLIGEPHQLIPYRRAPKDSTIYEVFIASPEHLRWVPTPNRFGLVTLGAQPVDFSDPPNSLDQIRRNNLIDVPWFGRTLSGHRAIFSFVEFHGKLDVGHYTATCRLSDL